MALQSASDQAAAIADAVLDALEKAGSEPPGAVEQLCALAVSEDRAAARAGTDALFKHIIEPLGDRFEPALCDSYVLFFSRVIDDCRRRPCCGAFDARLNEFGLENTDCFLQRAAEIRNPRIRPVSSAESGLVRLVLVPSRVTLGADVAVTSVVLSRLKTLFPKANICLLGSAKAGSLFASDPRVELMEAPYPRSGTLRERLDSWVALSHFVQARIEGLRSEEYLIVDPDSRLTQLGLLPLTPDDSRYCFFESRSYSRPGASSLAQLTACWFDGVFRPGEDHPLRQEVGPDGLCAVYPYIALPADDIERGTVLRTAVGGPIAAVNLGIGGNADKRVDDPFEQELLRGLLDSGYKLILDRGAGDEELHRTRGLLDSLQSLGKTISTLTPDRSSLAPSADVFVWEGSLSGFAGLIAVADLYAGYDSAGGHLAAALGVPVIDIFTPAAPRRMRERWTPCGRARVRVITAERTDPRRASVEFRKAVQEQRS